MSLIMGVKSHKAQVLHESIKHIMVTMSIVQPKKKAELRLLVKPFFGPICAIRLLCFKKDADHLEGSQNSDKNQSSRKHHLQRKYEHIQDFCYEVKHAGEINGEPFAQIYSSLSSADGTSSNRINPE